MSEIEGVPEGYELVRLGVANKGEYWMREDGSVFMATSDHMQGLFYPTVRKIEKPKRYRPFANAAEFKPHRDRWTYHPAYPDKLFRNSAYNDEGVFDGRTKYTYQDLFESGTLFEGGDVFGIEVTE